MNRNLKMWLAGGLVLLIGLGPAATGQEDEAAPVGSEVPYRQVFVRKQFAELVRRMLEVADLLAEREPGTARAIRMAVDQAQRAFIEENMAKVVEHFGKGLVALAQSTQADVVKELKSVLETLERGEVRTADEQKIRDWKSFLQTIQQLIKQEDQHQRDSRLAAEGEKLGSQMQKLGQKLKDIIERQKQLLRDTEKLPPAEDAAGKLAEARAAIRKLIEDETKLRDATAAATVGKLLLAAQEQDDLKQRAEGLAKKLEQLGGDKGVAAALAKAGTGGSEGASGGNAAKAAAGHTGKAAGAMGQALDKLNKTDAAGAGPHQDEAITALKEAEKALGGGMAALGAGSQAGQLAKDQTQLQKDTQELAKVVKDAASAAEAMGAGPQDASQGQPGNLDRAAGHMGNAAEKLGEQNKQAAADSEKKALDEMEGQSRRLGELARKLAEEARQADLTKQKTQQDQTAEQTGQLSKKMEKSSTKEQKTPGQPQVASAQGSMQQASKQLGGGNPGGASGSQDQASQSLREAARQLDEAIRRAQDARQEEALVKIEAILREILKSQQTITGGTAEVYNERKGQKYERSELVKLAELADGEGTLAEKVAHALKLVKDEGTTVVFPVVLDETRGDLSSVQQRLAQQQAGPLTQSIQQGIEQNLKDLIAALQSEIRRRRQGGGGGGGGGGGRPPLVPTSAELKMLRSRQTQIYQRTLVVNAQVASGELAGPEAKHHHDILAQRQGALKDMTAQLKAKMGRQ
ncbi:MAG: hypothetical protein AMJ81_10485 [Phycisphaerae bacterium SM23_33]|nr:MAG: hypothetical protein AMJ81_10485 [Phycisphaerae bacterium SM23_33]